MKIAEPARRRRRTPAWRPAALLLAAGTLGCADTIRPMLGGLKLGAAKEPVQMPVLQNEELPFEYPADAWERGVGGETLLHVHISRIGWVDSVEVARSSGDRSLDSAAVAGARLLRYRPAQHGGEPIGIWGWLPVHFPLPERADSTQAGYP